MIFCQSSWVFRGLKSGVERIRKENYYETFQMIFQWTLQNFLMYSSNLSCTDLEPNFLRRIHLFFGKNMTKHFSRWQTVSLIWGCRFLFFFFSAAILVSTPSPTSQTKHSAILDVWTCCKFRRQLNYWVLLLFLILFCSCMSLFAFLLSLIWPQLLCDRLPTISSFILEIKTYKLRYCADERFPPLFTSTQFCDGVRNVLILMDTDRTTNQPLQGRSFGEDWQGKRFNHNLNHNVGEKWTQNGNITEFCSRLVL